MSDNYFWIVLVLICIFCLLSMELYDRSDLPCFKESNKIKKRQPRQPETFFYFDGEILDDAEHTPSDLGKINYLRKSFSSTVPKILIGLLGDRIESLENYHIVNWKVRSQMGTFENEKCDAVDVFQGYLQIIPKGG